MRKPQVPDFNLSDWLSYDPDTGIFTWLRTSGKGYVGANAGTITKKGYLSIRIKGRSFLAHRLAWFFVYGVFPEHQIDHINGEKIDNRIANLRSATNQQNHANRGKQKNNTSGVKGVYWFKPQQCWKAQIQYNGKTIFLGYFKTKKLAAEARKAGEIIYQGEFAHGAPIAYGSRRIWLVEKFSTA